MREPPYRKPLMAKKVNPRKFTLKDVAFQKGFIAALKGKGRDDQPPWNPMMADSFEMGWDAYHKKKEKK